MQPHPIPQNVTTFQFHLIGDMTLKQFIYLASGVGFAYLVFIFFIRDYPYIAWPVIAISTLLGCAFAFVPINARPLDSWVAAFLKAIYSPTKRVWKKNNKLYSEDPTFNSRLLTYFSSLQPVKTTLFTPPGVKTTQIQPTIPASFEIPKQVELPTSEELKKTVELAKQAQILKMKIIQTERTLGQIKQVAQNQNQMPQDYTEQINKTLSDLQNLIIQASSIKQQIQSVQQEAIKPQPIIPRPKVKVVLPPKPQHTQVALTSFPNVINGIVKDPKANYLEGVVVVIYDKEGLPVRALKTNKLGQFTGSTPLPNGIYTVELEKDGFGFDVLQIELTGQLLPPIIITAKQAGVT